VERRHHLIEARYDIRTVQELPGHKDVTLMASISEFG
jgi:site-specific recombinase XerC